MHARSVLFAAMMALAAAPALAQGTAAINVSGTIEQVDAVSVSVRNDQGGKVQSFRLAPNVLVTRNAAATLADIRPNDFVASAAVHGADHDLQIGMVGLQSSPVQPSAMAATTSRSAMPAANPRWLSTPAFR